MDMPAADTSAMDGWAVSGPGPWRVVGEVLAGGNPVALAAGSAVSIATGSVVPAGADGVLRREWGRVEGALLRPDPDAPGCIQGRLVETGKDVRPAGGECRAGDVILPAGVALGPVAIGLLAASGQDEVAVRRACVDVLVLGDELLDRGPARDGRLRDALGPLLAGWLPALGVEIASRRRVADRAEDLAAALTVPRGDAVVTTGSTARGPVDHLHRVLADLGARLVVDGVAVRPGHPQFLAVLPDGRPVVGLPGNPLAAVSALLTLLAPVVAGLHGLPAPPSGVVRLVEDVGAGSDATRLLPVRDGRPVMFAGPAMLRGLALSDSLAVIPPGGAPWTPAGARSPPAAPGAGRAPDAAPHPPRPRRPGRPRTRHRSRARE
jgi:molybdopterin molybdotransferase